MLTLEEISAEYERITDRNVELRSKSYLTLEEKAELKRGSEEAQELFPLLEYARLKAKFNDTTIEAHLKELWKYKPVKHDNPEFRCGAPNLVQGGFCQRGVSMEGDKCYMHSGDW